jgi:tetratricopeptide (TPR) repeat protein
VEAGSGSWGELFCELENLLAGTRQGAPEAAARCSIIAIRVLMLTGPVSLGTDIADRILKLPDLPRHLQMQLEISRSRCLRIAGRMQEATEAIEGSTRRPSLSGKGPPDTHPGPLEDETLAILEADGLVELGNLDFQHSRYESADRNYHSALDIFRRFRHRKGEGNVLGQIGLIYGAQGNLTGAMTQFEAALVVHRERRDKRQEGITLANAGNVCLSLGQLELAEEHYQRAFVLSQEVGNKLAEGTILGALGNVRRVQGRLEEAMEHYEEALKNCREFGDRRVEGVFLGELGELLLMLKRTTEAEAVLREAIPSADEAMPLVAGVVQGTLALVLAGQGQIEEAQHLLETG